MVSSVVMAMRRGYDNEDKMQKQMAKMHAVPADQAASVMADLHLHGEGLAGSRRCATLRGVALTYPPERINIINWMILRVKAQGAFHSETEKRRAHVRAAYVGTTKM